MSIESNLFVWPRRIHTQGSRLEGQSLMLLPLRRCPSCSSSILKSSPTCSGRMQNWSHQTLCYSRQQQTHLWVWMIWTNSSHKKYPTSCGHMQLQARHIQSYSANWVIILWRWKTWVDSCHRISPKVGRHGNRKKQWLHLARHCQPPLGICHRRNNWLALFVRIICASCEVNLGQIE